MSGHISTAKELVAYIREEADYNRSWTDGRHPEIATSPDQVARRLELAQQRDQWANAVDALISGADLLRKSADAILVVRKAFGAPGNYGYGSAKGDALKTLYDAFNEIERAAISKAGV